MARTRCFCKGLVRLSRRILPPVLDPGNTGEARVVARKARARGDWTVPGGNFNPFLDLLSCTKMTCFLDRFQESVAPLQEPAVARASREPNTTQHNTIASMMRL